MRGDPQVTVDIGQGLNEVLQKMGIALRKMKE
jgi:hypothetical protein